MKRARDQCAMLQIILFFITNVLAPFALCLLMVLYYPLIMLFISSLLSPPPSANKYCNCY